MEGQQKATIIGAGLGGIAMAICLARRGYQVDVYERRPSVNQMDTSQRSFTVTLSKRGLHALSEIGLETELFKMTVPLRGRMVHHSEGGTTYLPYSNDDSEQLYAILRHDMNALLFQAAERYSNIRIHLNHTLLRLEKESNILHFQDDSQAGTPKVIVQTPLLIGCDGIFSTVRQQMQRGERSDYHQDCLDWGYKNVFMAADADGQHVMDGGVLHLWPRSHCTFFAFPNIDGTFSVNFIAPFALAEQLQTVEATQALLSRDFADLLEVAPTLPQQLVRLPMSYFITTYTSPWYYRDKIVLLGDAVHAVTPFWGEGMNAAYEDCLVLDQLLAEHQDNFHQAFKSFQEQRKPNTDLLAELAKQNFIELRDTTGSHRVMARKLIEKTLYRFFPGQWLPLNIMISHRLMSYVEAVERYKKQQQFGRYVGFNLAVWLVAFWLVARKLIGGVFRSSFNIRLLELERQTNIVGLSPQPGRTDSGVANGR